MKSVRMHMMQTVEVVGLKNAAQARPRPAPTGFDGEGTLHDAVRDLLTTYHDLNPPTVDILEDEPSPLEFMRYVARNRPFVVRNGAQDWKARKKWNTDYLSTVMKDQQVNVAITPHGNADSIITLPNPKAANGKADDSNPPMLFVKPHETTEPFETVIKYISQQELQHHNHHTQRTRYAQTQNDNLRHEYTTLFADVPPSIPFARIALQKDPDAINFWLGNSFSTTALHKDSYENVYVQILGKKHFVLLPPVEAPCVNERSVLAATYQPASSSLSSSSSSSSEDGNGNAEPSLLPCVDDPETYVPFATWDPDAPIVNATPFSRYSEPVRVTLEQGDMLYLPALWYHKVSQSCDEEGLCCAVNYWYDVEFSGGFWSMAGFVRGVGLLGDAESAG